MMRLIWATILASLFSAPVIAQQQAGSRPRVASRQAAGATAQPTEKTGTPAAAARVGNQPFPALTAKQQASLQRVLLAWEKQSQGTDTLDCRFTRWHYDLFAAPAGVHASKSEGIIKYAAPDKGLFKVQSKVFFGGMIEGKPQFAAQDGQYGEYWVCNGKELIEFDRSNEECRIQQLPPDMRGQKIFNSPLPFVFNLDAKQIQERYWVRQVPAPKPEIILIEAWPKRQEDRAQYTLVQIALDEQTFMPHALLMYAPNFDAKTQPKWDHYEFSEVKRNSIGQSMAMFLRNFIEEKPPASWKVLRDTFQPPVEPPRRTAQTPAQPSQR